jgi:hypothetical protein
MAQQLKSKPRYSFNFRYTENVKNAIDKIQKIKKIKYRNDAVVASILIFADGIVEE